VRLVKPLRSSFVHRVFDYRREHHLVCTVAFCFPFDAPKALVSEPEMWKMAASDLGRFGVLDHWMFKPTPELLVTGACYTGEREKGSEFVRVSLGPTDARRIDRRLYVFGERRWTLLGPSEPEMFTRMPLDYAHAFGGEKYPQNPIGKGLSPIKDESGAEHHPLPNVEDPRHAIKSKGDRPPPASFGPWDLTWPAHFEKKMGTYGRDHAEKNGYSLADDVDFSLFNVAPEEQRLKDGFTGTDELRVENMHPDRRVLDTRLPGFLGRCFVRFSPRYDATRALVEVPLKIDTVHLFPHRERAIVFCRGVLPIHTTDASCVELVLAAVDELEADARRPRAHYEEVLARRLDPERGALEALRDRELLPASAEVASTGPQVGDPIEEATKGEGLLAELAHRRTVKELERARERLLAQGLDPALVPEPPPAPRPPSVDLDTLPDRVDAALAQKEATELEAKRQQAELVEQLRALAEEHGFELPDLEAAPVHGDGPPSFTADGELERMRGMLALAEEGGTEVPELRAKLDDPNFRARLVDAERRVMTAYRLGAHLQPPVRPRTPEENERARSALLAWIHGLGPDERDLSGADLSGMELAGADLRGALLEAADLRGANLEGARLDDAVLAHAHLEGVRFAGATLRGANLGKTRATRAVLTGCDLRGATVYQADFSGADLSGAQLGAMQALELLAEGASFADAFGEQPFFFKAKLRGCTLRGARLPQAVFVQCDARGLDARSADLSQAAFLESDVDEARFTSARLENLRVVKSSMRRADLEGCAMFNSNLRGAQLAGARLAFTSLRRSDLSEADLTGADLEGMVACESLFMDTILRGAKLRGANLMLCVMHRADLAGADVSDANLFGADLSGAKGDARTSFRGSNVKRALVAGVFGG
jgi:uncharacterized protein YjbI with pentapeptide repeats